MRSVLRIFGFLVLCVGTDLRAGVPDYDFQWATIGAVGNPAYDGIAVSERLEGRGSVPYQYRISALEVTTSQVIEFLNTFSDQAWVFDTWLPSMPGANNVTPTQWELDPTLPNAAMIPVQGMTYRTAAMYCNWLHNGKSPQVSALLTGAYDLATTAAAADQIVPASLERSPEARFWIPSLDEWIKAAYFDPNRHGLGQPGWWEHPNASDAALIPGYPGEGQTSAGFYPEEGAWLIPLASYPDVRSPWGLLDLSGGADEWLEEPVGSSARVVGGSSAHGSLHEFRDALSWAGVFSDSGIFSSATLRVASIVPAPATAYGLLFLTLLRRGRRCGASSSVYLRALLHSNL